MSPVLEPESAGSVFRAYISLQLIEANKKIETGLLCPSFVCFDVFPPFLSQISVMFFLRASVDISLTWNGCSLVYILAAGTLAVKFCSCLITLKSIV